jgi:sulfur-oxidizing protein SoxY
MMSGSSAPPADLHEESGSRLAARRRALSMVGRALFAATLFPALRLRAETAPAAMNAAKPAFGAGSFAEVLRLLEASPTPSDDIALAVPDFVENGAMVPVEITSRLPGAQDIYIISEANPFPLVARFSVPDGTEAFVSTRIKVASSCNIHALVQSEGRFMSAVKATTVTVGGCGA